MIDITVQDVRRKTTKGELRQLKAFFEGCNQPLPWKARKLLIVDAKVGYSVLVKLCSETEFTEGEFLKRLAKVANIGFEEAKRCAKLIRKAIKQTTGIDEDGGRFSVKTTSMGDDPTAYEYKDVNIGVDHKGDEYIRKQSYLDKTKGEYFRRGVNWW